jgi:predicted acylesterase/phospholipase RssA
VNAPPAADDPRTYGYAPPEGLYCDVVLKGGITSGVVYPHAICVLADNFRFRNVGGTSAGAIAAAATAAAEHGREQGGFRDLAELPDWLESNLPKLFQPQRQTYGLFAIVLAAVRPGSKRQRVASALRAALDGFAYQALLGAAPGLLLAAYVVVNAAGGHGVLNVVSAIVGVVVALAVAIAGSALALAAAIARRALRAVPDNGYGLCSGFKTDEQTEPQPLTTWLHHSINRWASRPEDGPPLTFGELWRGPGSTAGAGVPEPEKRHVQLEMMTTNLTNRTGHRLPLDPAGWYFDEAEFRRLFPAKVVDHMVEHTPRPDGRVRPEGLRPWPAPEHLPVVVATRMSLSFPVLLSAIPLWRVDKQRNAGKDPPVAEPCWFSDGGIVSNFPLHFFDGFVPRWPTFAINLRPFALGRRESRHEHENVFMVEDEDEPITEWWYRWPEGGRGRLPSFLGGVISTMQNRVDEAQMRVPGYRDRVVHVGMTGEQGGLNLEMKEEVIRTLTKRGLYAGRRLADAYAPDPGESQRVTWLTHRWTRLHSAMAVFEVMLGRLSLGYWSDPLRPGDPSYPELLESRAGEKATRKWLAEEQRRLICAHAASARVLTEETRLSEHPLDGNAPEPRPVGRITPGD